MAAAAVADFKETKLSDKAISSKKSDDVQDQVKDQEGIEKILETFIFILGLYCDSRDKPIIHIDSYHIEDGKFVCSVRGFLNMKADTLEHMGICYG